MRLTAVALQDHRSSRERWNLRLHGESFSKNRALRNTGPINSFLGDQRALEYSTSGSQRAAVAADGAVRQLILILLNRTFCTALLRPTVATELRRTKVRRVHMPHGRIAVFPAFGYADMASRPLRVGIAFSRGRILGKECELIFPCIPLRVQFTLRVVEFD